MSFETLTDARSRYRNEAEVLDSIYRSFDTSAGNDEMLLRHRNHIERNQLGFGDRAFHWMWKLIVDDMKPDFTFLEIGVYKGQVISLVNLLAERTQRRVQITGVTPLSMAGDKNYIYDDVSYYDVIRELEDWCGVSQERRANIIKGYSTHSEVKTKCRALAPFDIVYIDGCHDFEVVSSDIISYSEQVASGGYLVMDDASAELQIPAGIWAGFPKVGRAIREILVPLGEFDEVVAVGHNRVWQRKK